MIVLDTNVVAEAMQPEPHPAVRAWLNDQVAETLYLSSVTLAELLFGIGALAAGKRKVGTRSLPSIAAGAPFPVPVPCSNPSVPDRHSPAHW